MMAYLLDFLLKEDQKSYIYIVIWFCSFLVL